ncbi:DUF4245 family protein [Nocardioides sp. R-C-SC26]|uniref:DUF4245 family protein n=1 Tax=Nocardioides sp. R-C-SC26 TaxID=2870414 RepID=UPI001E4003C1|nr:DUF4245 family protein [Nocardioides sp. R-C-SC26]
MSQQTPTASDAAGQEPSGRPGRYPRTFGGLIASMIVMVAVVLAFVFARSLVTDEPDIRTPDAVEYLPAIAQVQTGDYDAVYPSSLPTDWRVTGFTFAPGDRPSYGLNLFTDDGRFVGIRQADRDVEDMLAEFVDPEPREGEALAEPVLGATWTSWSDAGGDRAYSATLAELGASGDQTVVVFGDVSLDRLAELVTLLTIDPVPDPERPATGGGSTSGPAAD